MSDDVYAPHDYRFIVPPSTTLLEILQLVIAQSYLAFIAGGKATWVAQIQQKPVAVLAQQWQQPVLIAEKLLPVLDSSDMLQLHFRYYTQQNPEEVLASLRRSAV